MKVCKVCKLTKTLAEFYSHKSTTDGKQSKCISCSRDYYKQYYHKNKMHLQKKNKLYADAHRPQYREGHLKRAYGITLLDYNSMYQEQQGKCAICLELFPILHVDHDHVSKVVRRLLCADCNRGLGIFKDNPVLLRSAAAYIEQQQEFK